MNSRKKYIKLLLSFVLILTVCLGFYFIKLKSSVITEAQSKTYVRTTTLSKGTLENAVSATGVVESSTMTNVTSSVNAKITSIHVAVGDLVQKGDVIASLDQSALTSQISDLNEKISSAKSTLQSAYDQALSSKDSAWTTVFATNGTKAIFDSSNSNYQSAVASISSYQTTYDNAYNLNHNDALTMNINYSNYQAAKALVPLDTSDPNYSALLAASDQALQVYNTAKANYEQSLINMDTAKIALETAQKQINYATIKQTYDSAKMNYETTLAQYQKQESLLAESLSNLNSQSNSNLQSLIDQLDTLVETLENYELVAESNGTVTSLSATVGANVSNQSIATIQDVDHLQIIINVDETDIKSIALGMDCRISSDATTNEILGSVIAISPTASTQGQGSTSSTFSVTVEVLDGANGLLIGMNAQVDIILSTIDDVYVVPYDAVEVIDGKSYVYQQQNDSTEFEQIEISTGEENDYFIEIYGTNVSEGMIIRSSASVEEATTSDTNTSLPGQMPGNMGEMPSDMGERPGQGS